MTRPRWLAGSPPRPAGSACGSRAPCRARAWPATDPKAGLTAGELTLPVEHELLAAERQAALREALLTLPPSCQQLITLLIQDPPVPYARISATLGIPVGGIGPTRRRCLDKLRRHPAIAALISADPLPPGFGP